MCLPRIVMALLVCLALGAGSPVAAETFKLTTLDLENDVLSEPLIWWMKTVAERTGNRAQFQPFWGQSLVPLARTMSAVKSGIADAGYFVSAILSGEEKDFSVLELPGALPTDERYLRAWQAIKPVMTRILDRNGAVIMWPRRSPKTAIACKNRFLTQASDYAGLRIRAAGRWQIAAITRWGASAFPIPPADTYTALQRGTVDCTFHIYTLLWALKLYEVAPHVTQLDEATAFNFIGMNKDRWARLSEADRRVIEEVSREATQREIDALKRREENLIGELQRMSVRFHTPSPAERKRLTEAVKPLWQEVRKVMGPEGQTLADLLEPFQAHP